MSLQRSRFVRLFVLMILVLGLFFGIYRWTHRIDYPQNIANKLDVQRLLKAKKFDDLESLLAKYDKLMAANVRNEYSVYDEYAAFYIEDTSIDAPLEEWIKVKPKSASALLARAIHKTAQGWYQRGTGWASETSEKQFRGMEEHFEIAKKDAEASLGLDPEKFVAYLILVEIHNAEGNFGRQKYFFDQGVRHFPQSVLVHCWYLSAITPRWGGSYRQMSELIEQLQKPAKKNPALKALAGFIDYDKGMMECSNDRNQVAVDYFTKALSYGTLFQYLEHRGNCLLRLRKFDEAMKDAEQLVQLRPQDIGALNLRGSCYALMNKLNEANRDFNLAKSIDPMDGSIDAAKYSASEIKVVEAVELTKKLQWDAAFDAFKLASLIDPTNRQVYIFRGHSYFQRRQFDLALKDLTHAIEIAPHELNAYGYLTQVYVRQKRYTDAIASWDKYISLEPQKSEGYFYRGQDYALMGDLASAREDSKKACDLGNQDACAQLAKLSQQ